MGGTREIDSQRKSSGLSRCILYLQRGKVLHDGLVAGQHDVDAGHTLRGRFLRAGLRVGRGGLWRAQDVSERATGGRHQERGAKQDRDQWGALCPLIHSVRERQWEPPMRAGRQAPYLGYRLAVRAGGVQPGLVLEDAGTRCGGAGVQHHVDRRRTALPPPRRLLGPELPLPVPEVEHRLRRDDEQRGAGLELMTAGGRRAEGGRSCMAASPPAVSLAHSTNPTCPQSHPNCSAPRHTI